MKSHFLEATWSSGPHFAKQSDPDSKFRGASDFRPSARGASASVWNGSATGRRRAPPPSRLRAPGYPLQREGLVRKFPGSPRPSLESWCNERKDSRKHSRAASLPTESAAAHTSCTHVAQPQTRGGGRGEEEKQRKHADQSQVERRSKGNTRNCHNVPQHRSPALFNAHRFLSFIFIFHTGSVPNGTLELTTPRSRAACFTDWASQGP